MRLRSDGAELLVVISLHGTLYVGDECRFREQDIAEQTTQLGSKAPVLTALFLRPKQQTLIGYYNLELEWKALAHKNTPQHGGGIQVYFIVWLGN